MLQMEVGSDLDEELAILKAQILGDMSQDKAQLLNTASNVPTTKTSPEAVDVQLEDLRKKLDEL